MTNLDRHAAYLLSLADTLIPAFGRMPAFSGVCTMDDVARCLGFRPDVEADFERAVATRRADGDPRAAILQLAADDPRGFAALGLIVVSAYHMDPRVRELIGYPGQEIIPIRPTDAATDLRGDLLKPVVVRGRRYVPTPAA
jgi:hypothetical protein